MDNEWFTASPSAFLFVAASFVGVYVSIIVFTRIAGLRSFSKMSASDFAMTVAVGSLFASSISTSSPPLPIAVFAMGCLFAGQWTLAVLRRRSSAAANLLDNTPLLLMDHREYLTENMRSVNVTKNDITAKLREANVITLDQVRAVIFETTGDISVLHTTESGREVDEDVLTGVRRRVG